MRTASRSRGDHRRERALDDRADADEVEAALAGEREVVDVEDRELAPARLASSFGASVDADGSRTSSVDARVVVVAVGERRVDAGVDGVGLEVEHEGRLVRGARFSTVVRRRPPMAERGEDGRQRRGDPSHRRRA